MNTATMSSIGDAVMPFARLAGAHMGAAVGIAFVITSLPEIALFAIGAGLISVCWVEITKERS